MKVGGGCSGIQNQIGGRPMTTPSVDLHALDRFTPSDPVVRRVRVYRPSESFFNHRWNTLLPVPLPGKHP